MKRTPYKANCGKGWEPMCTYHILCKTLAFDKVITSLKIAGTSQGPCEHHPTHCSKDRLHSLRHFSKNHQGVFSHTWHGSQSPSFVFLQVPSIRPFLRGLQGWFLDSWLNKKLTFESFLPVPHWPYFCQCFTGKTIQIDQSWGLNLRWIY